MTAFAQVIAWRDEVVTLDRGIWLVEWNWTTSTFSWHRLNLPIEHMEEEQRWHKAI